MKKFILILPVLIAIIVCFSQFTKVHPAEKPVNKSINLSIYSNNNYSSAAYDSSIAFVHITVSKVVGGTYTTIYDKVLNSMQLKQFPNMQNALSSSLTIPNLLNNKEKLLINYAVTYNTQGSELTLNNYMITNAAKKENLIINI